MAQFLVVPSSDVSGGLITSLSNARLEPDNVITASGEVVVTFATADISPPFTPTGTNAVLGPRVISGSNADQILIVPSANVSGSVLTSISGSVVSTNLVVTGLLGGVAYRAVTLTAASPITDTATVPGQFIPSGWNVVDDASGGILKFTFTSIPANGGAAITDIYIYENGSTTPIATGLSAAGVYYLSSRANGTPYNYTVAAVNSKGVGPKSATKTATPTVSGGGGVGTLSYFLPDPVDRARRQQIVADHFPGTGADREFTGFTDLDLLTFSVQTAVSFADAITKINAVGVNSKVIIECAWDGVSSSTSNINGIAAASLTANATVDYGYTRHGQKILVRPAAGFSPSIRGTATNNGSDPSTASVWYGMNFLEFRNMTFDGTQMQFTSNATRPTPACVAFNGCNILNGPGDNGAFRVIPGIRSAHFENCIWDGCRCGYSGATNYLRIWNSVNINHADNDFISNRGYSGYARNWRARAWIAGLMLYSPSQTAFPGSGGNHLDIHQVSTTAAAGNVAEHDILYEFSIGYANRSEFAGATQGLFGDDGTATGAYHWMLHNALISVGGNKAIFPFDPTDDGTKIVTRMTLCRSGNGPGATSTVRNDNAMLVEGIKRRAGTGVGSLTVKDSIYSVSASTTGVVANDVRTNNLDCNPQKSAPVGKRMQDIFRGNGSWFNHPTDSMRQYVIGDQDQPPAIAKQLIRDFFEPIAGPQGSGYASAPGHVGMTDPMLWPTDFRNLS